MPVLTLVLPSDGTDADVVDYNTALLAIQALLNGGLDKDNLADGAIITTKLLDGAVITSKILDLAVTTQKLANKAVTAAKIEDQQAWQTPTYVNGWANYGAPYANGGYMKDSLGFVHLNGLIKSGTVGATAFTLPAGYRPANQHLFAIHSNGAIGRLDVLADGSVQVQSGNNAYVQLSGITFKAEA